MSLYTNQVSINSSNYFFLLANVSTLTANQIIAKSISTNSITGGSANFSSIQAQNGLFGDISANYINVNTISSQYTETNYAEISSMLCLTGLISAITTTNIILDGNYIDTGGAGAGATLLLNGFPIVTGASSSFSTLADWAYFPAASTLFMSLNNIEQAGNITCANINSQNIYNALTVQTDTLSALTNLTSPSGTITNFRATTISSVNTNTSNLFVASNIRAGGSLTIPSVSSQQVTTSSINATSGIFQTVSSVSINTNTLTARGVSTANISTGTINGQTFVSGSNWSQYPASSAVNMNGFALTNNTGQNFNIFPTSNLNITTSNGNLVQNYPINLTGGDVNIRADSGLDVGSFTDINLTSQNGNRGRINLTANSGFNNGVAGEINLTANGGSFLSVATGGSINLTANTPIGTPCNLTSKISLSAAGVNSYAGAIPPIASLLGYNFIYGNLGVNICAGLPPFLPNTVGTTYIYGTLGVEIPSDAYMKNIYPYWDGITTPPDLQITGRYIIPNLAQVCVRMSNVRQIYFQENVGTFMSNCDNIAMSSNGVITTSNFTTTNGTIGTLSNTNIVGAGGSITGYATLGTNNLNTNFINSLPVGSFLNQSTFTTASISSATISSINGFPINSLVNQTVSTFNTASISSASISSINGVAFSNLVNQTVSTFQTASISSLNVSSLNSGIRVGQKSLVVTGDVAQLQCSNTAGQQGTLNMLMRQNYAEIQTFNSNFTLPLNMKFTADNFGFNVDPTDIPGGIEFDISGNTQIEYGDLRVATGSSPLSASILTSNSLSTTEITCSTINGQSLPYAFGSFTGNTTQVVAGVGVATPIKFDTTELAVGTTLLNVSSIQVQKKGIFRIIASPQFATTSGGQKTVNIWLTKNSANVERTNSQYTIANNGESFTSVEFIQSANVGDYFGLSFQSTDANMALTTYPGTAVYPSTPSIILNLNQLNS